MSKTEKNKEMISQEITEVEGQAMEVAQENQSIVTGFSNNKNSTLVDMTVQTTLKDKKKIFNLENHEHTKINDCKGESLRVVDIYMKTIVSSLKQEDIIVDETTGEVIQDTKTSIITILIDEQDKTYVTASKTFAFDMMKYITQFGENSIKEGLEIKITEKPVKNSSNKALSFELL